MSEAIVLYDLSGEEQVLFSPAVAKELVSAGILYEAPPLVIEESEEEEE